MKKITFFIMLLINFKGISQPGFLDSTFGSNGIVTTPTLGFCQAACLQRDGKILTAGDNGFVCIVIRHLHNGNLDSSFGENGIKLIDVPLYEFETITGIVQLNDGKIIATGYGNVLGGFLKDDILITRLNSDGSLDSSFGDNGIRSYDFGYPEFTTGMQLSDDGKIVVAGYLNTNVQQFQRSVFAARFLLNGDVDISFSNDGIVLWSDFATNPLSTGLAIQNDGKILESAKDIVTPYKFIIARFNEDGSSDNNFGEHGFLESDLPAGNEFINVLSLQPDGKIIAAGRGHFNDGGSNAQMVVVRYNTNGNLDETFGDKGTTYIKFDARAEVNSVATQKDGKIIATGRIFQDAQPSFSTIALARLNENGILDSSFAINGMQVTDVGVYAGSTKVLIQNDGKIVNAGYREDFDTYVLCRYDNDPVKQNPLYTKIKRWIRKHILNFEDNNPNAAYYVIEKSTTAAGAYVPVTKINAIAVNNTYSYPLAATIQAASATDYYRIKTVNKDNSVTYSAPISSSDDAAVVAASLKIYPNPAKDRITIESAGAVKVRLQNSNGIVMFTQTINGKGSMDISKLHSGIYYVVNAESGESWKVVKE